MKKTTLKKIAALVFISVLIIMPVATAYAATIVEPTFHVFYTAKVSTTSGNLNVRSGPGTSYSIIGSLSNGTTVNIDGYTGTWMYIASPQIGWVSQDYLTDYTPR